MTAEHWSKSGMLCNSLVTFPWSHICVWNLHILWVIPGNICDLALVCLFSIFGLQMECNHSLSLCGLKIFHWFLTPIVVTVKSAVEVPVVSESYVFISFFPDWFSLWQLFLTVCVVFGILLWTNCASCISFSSCSRKFSATISCPDFFFSFWSTYVMHPRASCFYLLCLSLK